MILIALSKRLLPLTLLLPIGCVKEDGDKLIAIGKIAAGKVKELVPVNGPIDELTPEKSTAARVKSRLNNDVFLANAGIEISDDAGHITLRGKVASKEHIERAEQLATQTVGVTKVTNQLEITPGR
jgi:osmotically-inducible protein OsmY